MALVAVQVSIAVPCWDTAAGRPCAVAGCYLGVERLLKVEAGRRVVHTAS